MRNKRALLRVKLLTLVLITIVATVWVKYYWIDHQKIKTYEKLYSLSESDTRVAEMEIGILKATIKNNRKNLRKQLSKIESQMTQLQFDIQYLMDNQNKTVSTPEPNDQHITENMPVTTKTTESNEYKPSTKTKQHEKLPAQDNESEIKEREELMEIMVQDNESDPEWSMEARQSIYEAFSADEINSIHLENAECGATLCQAKLYLDGTTNFEDSYSEILNRTPWSGQGFAQIDEESGRIEFYLAREGHELPNLEAR